MARLWTSDRIFWQSARPELRARALFWDCTGGLFCGRRRSGVSVAGDCLAEKAGVEVADLGAGGAFCGARADSPGIKTYIVVEQGIWRLNARGRNVTDDARLFMEDATS